MAVTPMPRRQSDERLERAMGALLRAGVLLAAVVVLLGGIAMLVHGGPRIADYHTFAGESAELRTVRGTLGAALGLHPRAIVQVGILLLIATPVARVLFALLAFVVRRDALYATVSLIVLAVLATSLLAR
jgi:uncharacterized membrane protein